LRQQVFQLPDLFNIVPNQTRTITSGKRRDTILLMGDISADRAPVSITLT
jgi:hypothetical protein